MHGRQTKNATYNGVNTIFQFIYWFMNIRFANQCDRISINMHEQVPYTHFLYWKKMVERNVKQWKLLKKNNTKKLTIKIKKKLTTMEIVYIFLWHRYKIVQYFQRVIANICYIHNFSLVIKIKQVNHSRLIWIPLE